MKAISRALVTLAGFLETVPAETLNPDVALQVLEQLSQDLSAASEEEWRGLKEASLELANEVAESGPAFEDLARFYGSFESAFGHESPG